MRINPELEPLRPFDFASINVLEANPRQHWLQIEAVFVFLWIALVMWSVDDLLQGQQVVFHVNSKHKTYRPKWKGKSIFVDINTTR